MLTQLQTMIAVSVVMAASAPPATMKIVEEQDAVRAVSSCLDVRVSRTRPAILSLGLDSLGLGKCGASALRMHAATEAPFQMRREAADRLTVQYRRQDTDAAVGSGWQFEIGPDEMRLISTHSATEQPQPLVLEFDPKRCHATLLGMINPDTSMQLPALLHLPDQGSLRITAIGLKEASLGYDARRVGEGYVRVTFPPATKAHPRIEYRCQVAAIHPAIGEAESDLRLDGFRRNWLNIFQVNPRLRVLANHAASDTCAFCLYEYADIALHTPPLADKLTAMDLVRQSLDRYLEGLAGYGLPRNVMFDLGGKPTEDPPYLDSYPSLLIAAADYVQATNDRAWLEKQYGGIRAWAEKLLAMDHDGNGLFEYPYSGNSGSWSGKGERRPSNWWDTIGFGHEDAYANALAFRALRGMEELAAQLDRAADVQRYHVAAGRLRDTYFDAFYNPQTGVLAGWRSADGKLHDYCFLFVSGAAIHYGLVPTAKAGALMDRLLAKMSEVGYQRFDLGLPGNLLPVARRDYVHLERRWGGGQKEDNSDGFQIYENGGATACFAYFTVAALYDLGRRQEADRMLLPMLEAFAKGSFQGQGANGMSNDWKAWDGTPWGYEGFLVDNYYTLLAVLTRTGADRTRGPQPSTPGP